MDRRSETSTHQDRSLSIRIYRWRRLPRHVFIQYLSRTIGKRIHGEASASSAMELNHQPAPIWTSIVAAMIHITVRAPRSAA